MNSFEKQVALVTGGSSGIGQAVAKELAERGAKVLISGRDEARLKASAAQHTNISYVLADLAKPLGAAKAIDEVKRRFGKLDVLVNNAGVFELAPLEGSDPAHAHRTFDINVFGLIETTRLAVPLLKASKGNVVNVATTIADQPFANAAIYCASKAAVLALTRSWAQELAAHGIRVNAVSPGPIETPMFEPKKLGISAAELDALGGNILKLVPQGRFGKPAEVAQVISFVASGGASYVNGAQYTVGGGIEA